MVLEHQGLRVAVLTRRGSGRDINQDRLVVNDTVVDSDRRTTIMFALGCPSVVAVLDGLGGHPAGEIAAVLAAEVIAQGSSEVKTEQDVVSLVWWPTPHQPRTPSLPKSQHIAKPQFAPRLVELPMDVVDRMLG